MNRKGQSLNTVLFIFIAALVGVIIFQIVAQNIGTATSTFTIVNETHTLAANGASIYLTDYRYFDTIVITNATDGTTIDAGNYTVTTDVVYNGALAVQIQTDTTEVPSTSANISASNVQLSTYIDDAGSRSMATLIPILFALAIAAIALYPVYGSRFMDLIGK